MCVNIKALQLPTRMTVFSITTESYLTLKLCLNWTLLDHLADVFLNSCRISEGVRVPQPYALALQTKNETYASRTTLGGNICTSCITFNLRIE